MQASDMFGDGPLYNLPCTHSLTLPGNHRHCGQTSETASQNKAKAGSPHPFTVVFAASCEGCRDILDLRCSRVGFLSYAFYAFPSLMCFLYLFVRFVEVNSIRTQPEVIL
jgi:hypothetical protein